MTSQLQVIGHIEARYAGLSAGCDSLSCGKAFDVAAPRLGEVVVDLGCGRGQDVIRAAHAVGPTGLAIGVDRTAAMIEKARSSIPSDLSNVRLVCCDLAALDLAGHSVDVVISNCTINHAADKGAVYREIHRVLRPGGRFVVSDIVAERALPESVRNDPAAWAACYGGAIPEAEYIKAIQDAGFALPVVVSRSAPYEKGGVLIRSLAVSAHHS
jgi:ubiquinone/menaquinone biosynthesis C-methylase UbiE